MTTKACLLHCDDSVSILSLFEYACSLAERCVRVWIITPNEITSDNLPKEFKSLDMHVLKYLIFLYLPTNSDLLEKLNHFHEWQPKPGAILISQINKYVMTEHLSTEHFDVHNAAFIISNAFDCLQSDKIKKDERFLAITSSLNVHRDQLEPLSNLYFNDKFFMVDLGNYKEVLQLLIDS